MRSPTGSSASPPVGRRNHRHRGRHGDFALGDDGVMRGLPRRKSADPAALAGRSAFGTSAALDSGQADLAIGVLGEAIMLSRDLHHNTIGTLAFVFAVADASPAGAGRRTHCAFRRACTPPDHYRGRFRATRRRDDNRRRTRTGCNDGGQHAGEARRTDAWPWRWFFTRAHGPAVP